MEGFKINLYKLIGEKIKTKRSSLKMSQSNLAKELSVSRSTISNIEVGRHQIPIYLLYKVSNILKIEVNELLPQYEDIVASSSLESNLEDYLKNRNLSSKDRVVIEEQFNKL